MPGDFIPAGPYVSAVDAKVADAINDGTTTVAPSQNAVFDALALKAPLASPTFTGTPAAPTATQGTNTTQVATTGFVQTEVGLLVPKSTVTTKGDLIVATGPGAVTRRGVGSNGQVLTADSAQTDGVKWATPSAGAVDLSPPLPAGKYSHGIPGALGYAGATLSAGNIGAFLVYIPQSFDRIACTSTGSPTGATMRLGLYNIGSDGYPGAAIVTPSGTLNTGTPGVKEYTVSQGPIGWCFAVYQSGSNGSTLRSTATTGLVALAYPFSQPDTSATVNTLIYSSRTDAALPSDLTGFTWSSTTTGTFQVFQYRAA